MPLITRVYHATTPGFIVAGIVAHPDRRARGMGQFLEEEMAALGVRAVCGEGVRGSSPGGRTVLLQCRWM